MAMMDRKVTTTIEMKDKISDTLTGIEKRANTTSKSFSRLATESGTIEKSHGQYTKAVIKSVTTIKHGIKYTKEYAEAVKRLGRIKKEMATSAKADRVREKAALVTTRAAAKADAKRKKLIDGLGNSMYRFGRRTLYMGFVMSSIWRRVSKAIQGVVGVVSGLITEFSSAESASDFLTRTLERLAMGGALTGDKAEEVIRIWQEWFTASNELGAAVADIEIKFVQMKLGAVQSTTDFVTEVNTQLGLLNWDDIKTSIGDMADAFYDPLLTAISSVLNDEKGLGTLTEGLETIGSLSGEFMAGVIEQAANIVIAFGDIIGDDNSAARGLANQLGRITTSMGVLAVPTIATGLIVAALGQIAGAAVTTWATLGKIAAFLGMGTITLTISLVLAAGALIVIQKIWDTWKRLKEMGAVGWTGVGIDWTPPSAADIGDPTVNPDYVPDSPDPSGYDPNTGQPYKPWDPPSAPNVPSGYIDANLRTRRAGGLISQTGAYYLHAGERVKSTRGGEGNTITINVYGARNAEETAQAIGRKIRSVMIFP